MAKLLLAVVALVCPFTVVVAAEYGRCFQSGSTLDIEDCLSDQLGREDAELGKAMDKALAKLKASRSESSLLASSELTKAQEMWRQFRNSDCKAVYESYREGTIRNTKSLVCEIEKTQARRAELKKWWR